MAITKSTQTSRPSKPYPEYPLTPSGDGRRCKRIRERIHYCLGTWQQSLDEYQLTKFTCMRARLSQSHRTPLPCGMFATNPSH
jgi:hypothetical protein